MICRKQCMNALICLKSLKIHWNWNCLKILTVVLKDNSSLKQKHNFIPVATSKGRPFWTLFFYKHTYLVYSAVEWQDVFFSRCPYGIGLTFTVWSFISFWPWLSVQQNNCFLIKFLGLSTIQFIVRCDCKLWRNHIIECERERCCAHVFAKAIADTSSTRIIYWIVTITLFVHHPHEALDAVSQCLMTQDGEYELIFIPVIRLLIFWCVFQIIYS